MKRKIRNRGFTLLEVMVVVSVIGMLASLAIPYLFKAVVSAELNLCLNHQRALYEAVMQYELEQRKTMNTVASSGAAICSLLTTNGYVTKKLMFECPSSRIVDYDDYNLQYSGTSLTNTVCLVTPSTHIAK